MKKYIYFLPGFLFLLIVATGYGVFHSSNAYKTFMLYSSLVLSWALIEFWFKSRLRQQKVEMIYVPWKWVLFLSLPILGALPGVLVSGGEKINYGLSHELAVHIAYMIWLYYLVWALQDEKGVENFLYIGLNALFQIQAIEFLEKNTRYRLPDKQENC